MLLSKEIGMLPVKGMCSCRRGVLPSWLPAWLPTGVAPVVAFIRSAKLHDTKIKIHDAVRNSQAAGSI